MWPFKKKEIKQNIESEEFKIIIQKIKELARDLNNLEIDHNLMKGKLIKAITQKAIVNKEPQEQEKAKEQQAQSLNGMQYY